MIENRDSFLTTIAERLNRKEPLLVKPQRTYQYSPQLATLATASIDELVDIFINQCANIHTVVERCHVDTLPQTLQQVIEQIGGGSIIYNEDERLQQLALQPLLTELEAKVWTPHIGVANITFAESANIGLVVSDITLAESGTIVLQADVHKGRSVSFLPTNSIAIIPKSTLVARMTQAAHILRSQAMTASCINFISGPSNSADIELNLVVGVHGPIRMTYILVEDF